jgi:hypothetical protein
MLNSGWRGRAGGRAHLPSGGFAGLGTLNELYPVCLGFLVLEPLSSSFSLVLWAVGSTVLACMSALHASMPPESALHGAHMVRAGIIHALYVLFKY